MIGRMPAITTSIRRLGASLGVIASILLVAAGVFAPGAHAGTFTRGFVDDVWFDAPADGISTPQWMQKTQATGGKLAQIEVDWVSIEPNAPTPGESPTSPSAPEFDFSTIDQRVEEFEGTGLQPVFLVTDAPRWAEAKGGTADRVRGPAPTSRTRGAYGHLAQALADALFRHLPEPADPGTSFRACATCRRGGRRTPTSTWRRSGRRVHGRAVNTGATIVPRHS